MGIGILGCLSAERTCLDHVHQSSFQLKAVIAGLVLVNAVGMWLLDGAEN